MTRNPPLPALFAGVSLALSLGFSAPVAAQADMAATAEDAVAAAASPVRQDGMDAHVDESLLNPVQRLYVSIQQQRTTSAIGDALREALADRGADCPALMDYQVLGAQGTGRTLKIKCSERSLMLVKLDVDGGWQLTGGDGSVAPMSLADGRIVTLMGVDVSEYLATTPTEDPDSVVDMEMKPTAPVKTESETPVIFWMALAVGLLVLLSLAYLLWQERAWRRAHGARWARLTSDDKDRLITESRELYPDIFEHPGGVFIARGSRGKRRLFRSMTTAYLYRNFGMKIAELR